MPVTIDIQHELLTYTAFYERPAFALWGNGAQIVSGFHDALAPYQVSLRDIQITPNTSTAADPVVTITVGSAIVKFSFANLDVTFMNLGGSVLGKLPGFLDASTSWLKKLPEFKFGSHKFVYFQHSFLKGASVDEFLSKFSPKKFELQGVDLGSGVIFNRSVPERFWTTQITLDRSVPYPGALFFGLNIQIGTGEVEYAKLFDEAMSYYAGIMKAMDLESPYLAALIKQ
jgi:hypothetical protein